MNKEFFRIGIVSILFGILAAFFLLFFGIGFDVAASISFGLALGIFLGLAGWIDASICVAILFFAVAFALESRDIVLGVVAISSQLLVALLIRGVKLRIQRGSHARA